MSSRDAYTAIADPTRREILDLLRERHTAPAGEIASHFRRVSRPAISRHLRVLRECGVVSAYRQGKTHNYVLNAEPLNEIRDGWLAAFAEMQVESLRRLRDIVESRDSPEATPTARRRGARAGGASRRRGSPPAAR